MRAEMVFLRSCSNPKLPRHISTPRQAASRSILECLKGLARGAGPARAIVTRAVGITQPGRPIRRPQQQQEECPVSPVSGSGSAACRTLHDNLPFGRAYAPPPSPASLLQDHFKDRKLIGHCVRFNSGVPYLCRSISSQVQIFLRGGDKNSTNRQCLNRIFIL